MIGYQEKHQAFGYLKIPISTYFVSPDNVDALNHLRSILNHHTIHNVSNGIEPYHLNLLNLNNEVAATVIMHDLVIEWDMIYEEN